MGSLFFNHYDLAVNTDIRITLNPSCTLNARTLCMDNCIRLSVRVHKLHFHLWCPMPPRNVCEQVGGSCKIHKLQGIKTLYLLYTFLLTILNYTFILPDFLQSNVGLTWPSATRILMLIWICTLNIKLEKICHEISILGGWESSCLVPLYEIMIQLSYSG